MPKKIFKSTTKLFKKVFVIGSIDLLLHLTLLNFFHPDPYYFQPMNYCRDLS